MVDIVLKWAWLIPPPDFTRRNSSTNTERIRIILWYWLWITELSCYIWSKSNQSRNFPTVLLHENQLFMTCVGKLQTKLNRKTEDPSDGCLMGEEMSVQQCEKHLSAWSAVAWQCRWAGWCLRSLDSSTPPPCLCSFLAGTWLAEGNNRETHAGSKWRVQNLSAL